MKNHFSVIIPLYNKCDYIKRAVDSVLKQSYPCFELIIVNDGSSDGGEKLIDTISDSRVNLIHQPNRGVSVARNQGVSVAKYDHVAFLDADDTWHEDFLKDLNNLVNKYPKGSVYGLNHVSVYENGTMHAEDYRWLFKGESDGIIEDYFGLFAFLGKSPFSNSGCCFPRELFLRNGGYQPGVKITEDSDLWCRMALLGDVVFCIAPRATYYLEIPNNTRTLMEYSDYQVSKTLQALLEQGKIPGEKILSVKKLIAFQQISLVKRAIIKGQRSFALAKIWNKYLWRFRPMQSLIHALIALIPTPVFFMIRKLASRRFS